MEDRMLLYFQGKLSGEERIKLLLEIQSNIELKNQFLSYQNIIGLFELSEEKRNQHAGKKGYKSFRKRYQKKTIKRQLLQFSKYAAVITGVVITTWFIKPDKEQSMQLIPHPQELLVPAGQRARITLPDGSNVWVNAGSTLDYPSFFTNERRVKLNGEAYFEVSADKEKPFIVSTAELDILALGTQFNVNSYLKGDCSSVILTEGSVQVYSSCYPEESIILKPDQQVFYINQTFILDDFTDKDKLLWKEGIYSFKKEKLEFIIRKLELYYDVKIIVQDKMILDYEYTGKFRQRESVLEILRLIQKIHKFKIETNKELNQITLMK